VLAIGALLRAPQLHGGGGGRRACNGAKFFSRKYVLKNSPFVTVMRYREGSPEKSNGGTAKSPNTGLLAILHQGTEIQLGWPVSVKHSSV